MSNHLLKPATAGLLQRIRRAGRPAVHTLTPEAARSAYEAGAEVLDLPRARLARVEDLELPAWVILAESDPLVDEGLVRGVTHDFIKMGRVLDEAVHALDAAAFALKEARRR